jgi:hypothetical protein
VPPDEPLLKELADTMAAENGYTSQHSYDLYDTTGTTEDWSYFATGGLGYTFEIGRLDNAQGGAVAGAGFHPPYPYGVVAEWFGKPPTGGGNREAYYLALESTADEKRHAVLTGSGEPGATIRVRKTFTSLTKGSDEQGPVSFPEELVSTMAVPPSGAFEFHVNQSTRPLVVPDRTEAWTLTCEKDGKVVSSQDVVVARGERKEVGNACVRALSSQPGRPGFSVTVTAPKTTLRALVRKGLPVRATCSSRCTLTARLVQGKRRVGGATKRGITKTTVQVKLTRAAARKLRRAKRATLELQILARAGDQTATAGKRLKLRR